ncbi:Cell wall-associated hydrolase, NlpC family [Thermus arciformis]|uniref:Cell wall-associated hydrolase, NlpC family n=1 Tax=Thermus arciformis TaxID=482827 RepID=A0A1G7D6J2_9DEIN|nr:C40 family peptidase [Thermus arciformis]SDE46566.1 Cell wall-associated hydrolase, NlpC family [Thermus arciformis]
MRRAAFALALGLALAQPTHTVAPGETLYSIARRHGTTVEELMRLNGLESFLLQPGQVLRLPEKAPASRVHVVAPGDTLFSLAQRYGTTVEELMRLNGLASADLKVGQRLLLPGAQAEGGSTPPGPTPEAPSPSPPPEDYDPESPLLRAVLRYLGVPYKYGANSPLSLDCSAFVAQVYAELGVALPRTSKEQYQAFPPAEALRPGDLVFFSFGGKEVDHVGIYLGRGVFAHASSYGSRVVIESLEAPFYRKAYRGARRVMASPAPLPGPSAGR